MGLLFDKISFNDKLTTFNDKIEEFRKFSKTGRLKEAYMTIIDPFPIARSRFLSKAEKFANRMVAVLEDNLSIELIFFYYNLFKFFLSFPIILGKGCLVFYQK